MSWSYGQEVMAHEAAYAAAMREKQARQDRRAKNPVERFGVRPSRRHLTHHGDLPGLDFSRG